MTRYPSLEQYGLIGNLETCALVNDEGEIEWLPMPHVESSSVFASVLDAEDGGYWRIQPTEPFDSEQSYLDETNVLETTFETDSGRVRVIDFMTVRDDGMERAVYRKVAPVEGSVELELTFDPRLDYARGVTDVESVDNGIRVTDGSSDDSGGTDDGEFVFLSGGAEFEVDEGTVRTTWSVSADESTWFVLSHDETREAVPDDCEDRLQRTAEFWHDWVHSCPDGCAFDGVHHDLAVRSGLVLKLLTHRETGAICAAPTTSLPENVGGVRN
jgi:GH15 family glucan-1,4-alpha-glucosidase